MGNHVARAKSGVGNEVNEGAAQALAKTLIVSEEEQTIFPDGTTQAGAELVQSKRRDLRAVERRARIECVVAHGVKRASVIAIGSGLRHDDNLRATGGAAFGGIDSGAHAKLGDGVQRNVQARVGLLRLFLHTARVDAV